MKVKLVNKLTHSVMFVDEARVNDYLAAGHTLAAKPAKAPAKPRSKAKKAGASDGTN